MHGLKPSEALDRFKVVRIAAAQPEVALAWAARKDHLAKARDFLTITGPGPVLLEP